MMHINYRDWYWYVGGDNSKVYSSKRNTYVSPSTDADFAASNITPINVASEADIWMYMQRRLPAWLYDGETFSQPAEGEYTKKQLTAYARDVRWRKEVGGLTVSGISVLTDDRSKTMIAGARLAADADNGFTTAWDAADGTVHELNATQVIAISDAVKAHVKNCFDTFKTVKDEIDAGLITILEDIDSAFT